MAKLLSMVFALILAIFAVVFWMNPKEFNGDAPSHAQVTSNARIGGAFELMDTTGRVVRDSDFKGRYRLVFFGFTHCPDICPTTLLVISNVLRELGSDAEKVAPLFITLDPERDTPEIMGQYVRNFHPSLIGLTGTPEQVKAVADAYKVYYSRIDQPDSAVDYVVDHSGYIFLMDQHGEYVTHFPHNVSEQTLAKELKRVLDRD